MSSRLLMYTYAPLNNYCHLRVCALLHLIGTSTYRIVSLYAFLTHFQNWKCYSRLGGHETRESDHYIGLSKSCFDYNTMDIIDWSWVWSIYLHMTGIRIWRVQDIFWYLISRCGAIDLKPRRDNSITLNGDFKPLVIRFYSYVSADWEV